jgi:hypothetical protein
MTNTCKFCLLLIAIGCSACSSKSELIKPKGEWRQINTPKALHPKQNPSPTEPLPAEGTNEKTRS